MQYSYNTTEYNDITRKGKSAEPVKAKVERDHPLKGDRVRLVLRVRTIHDSLCLKKGNEFFKKVMVSCLPTTLGTKKEKRKKKPDVNKVNPYVHLIDKLLRENALGLAIPV